MTSDHYFSKADLEGISTRVQSGQQLHFDPKQIEQFVATIATVKPGKRVGLFIFGFFAIIIAVVVGAIYLIARSVMR
jgi:hypothetical protein